MTAPTGKGARIVVADDSIVVRTLLRRQLEEHGHIVIEAVDGEDALRACRDHRPDLVLLDVEMPKLDGHAVLAALRADPDLADTPVVFLTARTTTEDVVEGLRLGAHDYLRKPFEPAELLARVSAAHRVKSLQDQLRQRNAELDAMSRTDALTGLPNRRHLQDHLLATASAARRHGQSLAILMVDIDHFKDVNDTLGHDGGDRVLREIAARVSAACRTEDVAGRWGGEEFLVVAPFTDRESAASLAESIRDAIASQPLASSGQLVVDVTVSIGAAAGAGDIDALVKEADDALYAAKDAGRNRVVVASPI
ncbi:MAG: two-component system, cell cycle response regulator [Actinomycetota bacterium]|nr:two-component system, cell cycle response regulator [Actinomycetota bacterium]